MPVGESGLVSRTIQILRAVAGRPAGVGLSEVARISGIPKASCYRVLDVLEQERWLVCDDETRKYRLSLGILSIVGGLLDADGAYGHMKTVVRHLATESEETAGFDVLLEPHVMVVAQESGPRLIGQTPNPVPRSQPVWATSTGRVLLSELNPGDIREKFKSEFDNALDAPDMDAFIESLEAVRDSGFAFVRDGLEVGAASLAAPIRVKGAIQYAVWIGGPTFRINESRLSELSGLVIGAAQRISDLLKVTDLTLPVMNV